MDTNNIMREKQYSQEIYLNKIILWKTGVLTDWRKGVLNGDERKKKTSKH